MSVSRIGQMQAKPDQVEQMREFLLSIMPGIKNSSGCESVQLYQSQDDPSNFIMIEVWDRVESHQASVRNISAEELEKIRPLLASPPRGSYFGMVAGV